MYSLNSSHFSTVKVLRYTVYRKIWCMVNYIVDHNYCFLFRYALKVGELSEPVFTDSEDCLVLPWHHDLYYNLVVLCDIIMNTS